MKALGASGVVFAALAVVGCGAPAVEADALVTDGDAPTHDASSDAGSLADAGDAFANSRPIADPGPDVVVHRTAEVWLDGAGSSDPDGDPLTYQWLLVASPGDSSSTLGSSDRYAWITVDREGTYVVALVVTDGHQTSEAALLTITVENATPLAEAGVDRSVLPGAMVTLFGAGHDPAGDPLTFHWTTVSRPAESNAVLDEPTSDSPRFVADLRGTYVFDLVVDDGRARSEPDRVEIVARNSLPTVDAGTSQTVRPGDEVPLSGTASDVDGDPLELQWSIVQRPARSQATVASPGEATAVLVTDEPGLYRIRLSASDGFGVTSDEVEVLAEPTVLPLSNGVVDAEYLGGHVVMLATQIGVSFLHLDTGEEVVVPLSAPAVALSVNEDRTRAVVGHAGVLSVVDLATRTAVHTWPVSTAAISDVVYSRDGWAYVFPATGGSTQIHGVQLDTGVEVLGWGMTAGRRAKQHPSYDALYVTRSGIERYSASSGDTQYETLFEDALMYPVGNNLWFLRDGRIVTERGRAFWTRPVVSEDLEYAGSLANTVTVRSVDQDDVTGQVAVLGPSQLDLYGEEYLTPEQTILLPTLVIGEEWVEPQGLFVFYVEGVPVVLMRATPSSGPARVVLWQAW